MNKQPPVEWCESLAESMLDRLPSYDTYPCPQCGTGISFPRIARQQDVDDFQMILDCAKAYLAENGVMDKIVDDLLAKICDLRRVKHLRLVRGGQSG